MSVDQTESVDTLVKLVLEDNCFLGYYPCLGSSKKEWVLGEIDESGVLHVHDIIPSESLISFLLRLIQRYLETRFGDASEG